MKFKKFTLYALFVIVLVAIYAFINHPTTYSLTIPYIDITLTYSLIFWLIVPALALYILGSANMACGKVAECLKDRADNKERIRLKEYIKSAILGKEIECEFKLDKYKELYFLLKRAKFYPNINSPRSGDSEFDERFDEMARIYSGEYVELKRDIDKQSDLYIKNLQNRVEMDQKFAIEVLKKEGDYEPSLVKSAFLKLLKSGSDKEIKKYLHLFSGDKMMCQKILPLVFKNEIPLKLSKEEILDLIRDSNIDKGELLNIAIASKEHLAPDELLELFRYLYENRMETAQDAFLYVLFELEMIEKASEILSNSGQNELLKFKAYLNLKESGKHYPINLFF